MKSFFLYAHESMSILSKMHVVWRKIAKRERRRRIRTQQAKHRDTEAIKELSAEEYGKWLKEQEADEAFELEQINKSNMVEHLKWLEAEEVLLAQWQKLQEKQELMKQKRLEHEAKLKLEWELEKERKKKKEEELKRIEEENKRKQEIFMQNLDDFLKGDSNQPPPELMISRETKPNADICPFFYKTACCRFGDQCSRNHKYPGISKVLVATNFYIHFGLDNSNSNEYDTDVMLEYDDTDTYREFQDFFYDVVPEFEKFGKIVQFKVCNNHEKHLRGNTYVEFAELRSAVAAYQALHTRWYGGRQLSLQFCLISSWKNAICGLQSRRRCPKGRACNFLHVFKNPKDAYNLYTSDRHHYESERLQRTPRSWRWSESPELETPKRKRSRSSERRHRKDDRERRERSKDGSRSHRRRRSQGSPDRSRRRQ